jgi:hypothetical protein
MPLGGLAASKPVGVDRDGSEQHDKPNTTCEDDAPPLD